jgi:hypothetical protein
MPPPHTQHTPAPNPKPKVTPVEAAAYSRATIWVDVSVGYFSSSSANAPATWGVAMLVPPKEAYPPS